MVNPIYVKVNLYNQVICILPEGNASIAELRFNRDYLKIKTYRPIHTECCYLTFKLLYYKFV